MIVFSDYIPSQTKYINTCILGIQMVGYYIFKNLHVGCNVDSPLPNAKFISLVGVSRKYKRKFNVIWFFFGLNIKLIIMVFLNNQGGARNFCLRGSICVANLLIYTNFYIHTQTHVSIHTQKKLVSFIMNP